MASPLQRPPEHPSRAYSASPGMAQFRPSPSPLNEPYSVGASSSNSVFYHQSGISVSSSPAPAPDSVRLPGTPGSGSTAIHATSPATSSYASTPAQSLPQSQQPATPQSQQPSQPSDQNRGTTPTATTTASENAMDPAVNKCARFFKTLLHLSTNNNPGTLVTVRQLVRGVVFGNLDPQEFTVRLQQALASQAQPHLLPFLRKTLPSLRQALISGRQTIEGIGTAEEYAAEMATGIPTSVTTVMASVSHASTSSATSDMPMSQPYLQAKRLKMEDEDSRSSSGSLQPSYANVPNGIKQEATSANVIQPGTAMSMSTLPGGISDQPVVANGLEQSSINGIVLTDESGHLIPSATDRPLLTRPLITDELQYTTLDAQAVAERIKAEMPECDNIDGDVIELISNAVETRLRGLLANLAAVAEHRLEPLRLNPFYEQVDDTRQQLRFIEEIERQAYDRRESLEREALIRLTKSKGKDKDTVEKAKQLQKADQEAALNREANAAAIAALGGSKKQKRSWADTNNPFEHSVSSNLGAQTQRARIKRVTMRDLQFVLSSDPFAPKSQIRHRVAFASLAADPNVQL
jgi:transcription initiation factor TFIID subunit 4